MSDNTNRKLRKRRPPAYLVGDNSDPEQFGYARTTFTRDFVSPAQELNSLAKLLSKFVNSANKRLLEKVNLSQGKDDVSAKNGNLSNAEQTKKNAPINEGGKRRQFQKVEPKDNVGKPSRQVPGLKQLQHQMNIGKDKIKAQQQKRKEEQMNKALKVNKSMGKPSTMQIDFSREINMQGQPGMSLSTGNRTQLDAAMRALEQQQQILNYNPHLREKLQAQQNFQSRSQHSNQKFFRRSTYHIAIAYQIHLNNLKDSGKDLQTPMYLDPTYPAKKLKGQYQKP